MARRNNWSWYDRQRKAPVFAEGDLVRFEHGRTSKAKLPLVWEVVDVSKQSVYPFEVSVRSTRSGRTCSRIHPRQLRLHKAVAEMVAEALMGTLESKRPTSPVKSV